MVDSIDYPIDSLREGYDDFGLFRARFGGNHTGIDIGFDRWGDPVHAAARGRVTYSDTAGWDTEKGVVIVEHTFPDASIAYTLYGHMEQTDTIFFPRVGDCVEKGTVLGGIGWPSRGRPHLHYEIRNFLPDDGGPGYVTDNPLLEGWYHPLDFTELWRIRLSPGYVSSTTFKSVPGLPPVALSSGMYALANGNSIQGANAAGDVVWRLETDGVITGIAALPGDRVVAHTRNGQAMTLQNGRYLALWNIQGLEEQFLTLGEHLIFVTDGGGLAAYDPAGTALWSLPPVSTAARVFDFETNGQQIAIGARAEDGTISWRLAASDGQLAYETQFNTIAVIAPDRDGNWIALDGVQVKRLAGGQNHDLATISPLPGRSAHATVDLLGNSYIYLADAENTLLAINPAGQVRWRVNYPVAPHSLPPLMQTGNGCLLYTLDMDGVLNVFDTANGDLINQSKLYAGGDQTGNPRARMLQVDAGEQVRFGSGFLSLVTLDGWALGGERAANCRLG
jgi:murein DD-endopeptidase MepM/ murein hydrolase activator NlpD